MNVTDRWAPEDEIDVRRIWAVVTKSKWIIMGLPIVAAGLTAVAVSFMTPVFDSSASLVIGSVNANIVSIEDVYGQDTRNRKYFDTQIVILKSRPLAETVVRQLNIAAHPEYANRPSATPKWLDWRSWFGMEKESSDISREQLAVLKYADRLHIRPVSRTQIVNVTFESQDPVLAANVANAHAQAYIESMMEARLGLTETAITWMTAKLGDLQASLRESERLLQDFREKYGVIDYDGLKALPSQEIADLRSNLSVARQQVGQTRAIFLQAYPGGGDNPADDLSGISVIQDDPMCQDFQRAVIEAQYKFDEFSKRLGPAHPTMIDAQSALDRAFQNVRIGERRVAERIRKDYESSMAQEAELTATLRRAEARYQAIGRTEAEFVALERDVATNRDLYDMFYSRIKETAQTVDLKRAEARILSPAIVPIRPFSPDRDLIVAMTYAAALFFTVLAAFVVEAVNDKIDVSTVERRLATPLLSMVPLVSKRKISGSIANLFKFGGHPAFIEAIRTLRTGISLHGTEGLSKVVLITSALGDEGKSTIAINLAHAFAKMENVLLIDADFRKPSVARRLGISEQPFGLVELLSESTNLDDCVMHSDNEKLDVLAVGSIPNDSLQLLASPRLSSVMRVLRIKYDRIIIDSPPTLPVSDALVLSAQADAVVLVIKSKTTRLIEVKTALARLQRVSAPVIGVVVNRWDTSGVGGYGAYVHGHEYGQYQPDQPKVLSG